MFKKIPVLGTVLGVVVMLAIVLCGLVNGSAIKDIIKLCLYAGVTIILLCLYFCILGQNVRKMPYFHIIFVTDFFLAILFIMTIGVKSPLSLLLIGGIIIAILFDLQLGICVTDLMIIFAGFALHLNGNEIAYLLITGTLLCFMTPFMKRTRTIGLTVIIVLSIQVIILLTNNYLIFEYFLYKKVLLELLGTLVIIPGASFFYELYKKHADSYFKLVKEKKLAQKQEDRPIEENGQGNKQLEKNQNERLFQILSNDFPLLKKFEETAPKVYEHAIKVSEICGQAAKVAGLNEPLAKAGGMYHEIGKMESGDYLQDGIRIATEHQLPKEVIEIIRTHNLKYSKPQSPEGAIVNLTISVLSAIEYLKLNLDGKQIENKENRDRIVTRAIEELFQMRLQKNSLDESGLTIKQFHNLKAFYLSNLEF